MSKVLLQCEGEYEYVGLSARVLGVLINKSHIDLYIDVTGCYERGSFGRVNGLELDSPVFQRSRPSIALSLGLGYLCASSGIVAGITKN